MHVEKLGGGDQNIEKTMAQFLDVLKKSGGGL